MSTVNLPSVEQIGESRSKLWHQNDQPLLTVEGLRAWVGAAGLVLYTPRAGQLPAPAPSVAEAVLGRANGQMTLAEVGEARTLLARMIGEGSAVPLNLMGAVSEVPDFVCSPAVFPYVFTLRGDKAWKQPPVTSGPVKVSPLALAAYGVLQRGVTLETAELVSELGKEVTETAVLRAMSELWSQLRVLPIPQVDGPTRWELTSTRFTKQMKAGGNAGQPTALSALISLYLGMAVVATEEEIETMLSPVAARSRIRDVVHALIGARELDTIAIEGRTVLHVAGDLPEYGQVTEVGQEAGEEASLEVVLAADGAEPVEGAGRITKFVAKPRKVGTGFAKKFTPRTEGDRERRPFAKRAGAAESGPGRGGFQKPRSSGPTDGAGRARPGFSRNDGGTRPTFRRETPAAGAEVGGERGERKTFSKPGTFGRKREQREGGPGFAGGERGPAGRDARGERPARGASAGERPVRRSFDGAGGDGGGGARGGFERRPGSYMARPQGTGSEGKRPFSPREGLGTKRTYGPSSGSDGKRADGRGRDGAEGGEAPRKTFRKFDAPRERGPREPRGAGGGRPFEKAQGSRPFPAERGGGEGGGARPGAKRTFSGAGVGGRPGSGERSGPSEGRGGRPGVKRTFSGPRAGSGPGAFGARSGPRTGSTNGPRTGSPNGAGGAFAKFADGKRPFRKAGAGGKGAGGSKRTGGGVEGEVRRRRPEGGDEA